MEPRELLQDGQHYLIAVCSWCGRMVDTLLDQQPGFSLLGLCFESLPHVDRMGEPCRNSGMPKGVQFHRVPIRRVRRKHAEKTDSG